MEVDPISKSADLDQIIRAIVHVIRDQDLGKWRLINKFCNKLLISELHRRQVPVTLRDDEEVRSFVTTMTARRQATIPFRSYSLALGSISLEQIDSLVQTIGPNSVDRVKFYDFLPDWDPYEVLFFPQDIQAGYREKGIQRKLLTVLDAAAVTLVELQINADTDIPITPYECERFPRGFPHLTKISVDYVSVIADETKDDVVSMVVARSLSLDHIRFKVWDGPNSRFTAKIPGYLYPEPARSTVPKLSLVTEVTAKDQTTVDSLVAHGYTGFTYLVLCFTHDDLDVSFLASVQPLLTNQIHLETLFLQIYTRPGIFITPLQLPQLKRLKTLIISLMFTEDKSPIEPFTQDQFPVLRSLSLFGCHLCEFGWFTHVVMPTVTKLVIWDYQGPAGAETWHLSFPQLNTLEVEVSPAGVPFLEYVFTHLTGLHVLEVGSSLTSVTLGMPSDLWRLYTGTSDILSKDDVLKFADQEKEATSLSEPQPTETVPNSVHAVYSTPSLANFRHLKELKVWTRTEVEILALVYMSRPGGLTVLDKLTVGYRPIEEDDSDTPTTISTDPSDVSGIQFRSVDLPSQQSEVTTATSGGDVTEVLNSVVETLEDEGEEDEDDAEQDRADDNWVDDGTDVDHEFRINLGFGFNRSVMPHQVDASDSGIDPNYISILEKYHKDVTILKT